MWVGVRGRIRVVGDVGLGVAGGFERRGCPGSRPAAVVRWLRPRRVLLSSRRANATWIMTPGIARQTLAGARLLRSGTTRIHVAAAVVLLAAVAEFSTPLPGFRLLLVAVVVVAPAVLFDRFWRALLLLGSGGVDVLLAKRRRRDWWGWTRLWLAFVVVWGLDLIATVWFFFVPTVVELHPVTVFLYGVAGVPGVLFAGVSYALLVVVTVRALPRPWGFDLLLLATLSYGLFVVHNYVLLLGGRA
jgi:hypothetical protein